MKAKHRDLISRNNLVVTGNFIWWKINSTKKYYQAEESPGAISEKIIHHKKETLHQISLYKFQGGRKTDNDFECLIMCAFVGMGVGVRG